MKTIILVLFDAKLKDHYKNVHSHKMTQKLYY